MDRDYCMRIGSPPAFFGVRPGSAGGPFYLSVREKHSMFTMLLPVLPHYTYPTSIQVFSPYCINLSGISQKKHQLLIQRLVFFFYPIVAQIPLQQWLSRTFSRKGILNQLLFSLRKQARKAKSLSAPVLFTPPRSKWRIPEFYQIVYLGFLQPLDHSA